MNWNEKCSCQKGEKKQIMTTKNKNLFNNDKLLEDED